jgi:hypothetical protein
MNTTLNIFVLDGISFYTAGHGCDKDAPISSGTHPAGLLCNKTVDGFAWAKCPTQQNDSQVY